MTLDPNSVTNGDMVDQLKKELTTDTEPFIPSIDEQIGIDAFNAGRNIFDVINEGRGIESMGAVIDRIKAIAAGYDRAYITSLMNQNDSYKVAMDRTTFKKGTQLVVSLNVEDSISSAAIYKSLHSEKHILLAGCLVMEVNVVRDK